MARKSHKYLPEEALIDETLNHIITLRNEFNVKRKLGQYIFLNLVIIWGYNLSGFARSAVCYISLKRKSGGFDKDEVLHYQLARYELYFYQSP